MLRQLLSTDMAEDAVQLVQAVVADDQLSLAARSLLNQYLGTKALGQVLLQCGDVGISFVRRSNRCR